MSKSTTCAGSHSDPMRTAHDRVQCAVCNRWLIVSERGLLPRHVARLKKRPRAQRVTMTKNADGTMTVRAYGGVDLRKVFGGGS